MNVKYVHKVPLITGFCYSESLIVCLMFVFVFLGKIPGKCLSAQNRCILEVFSVIRKVNRDFNLWNKILYEDFGNRSESQQFVGESPHTEAQPSHAVVEHNSNHHLFSLIVIYFIYLNSFIILFFFYFILLLFLYLYFVLLIFFFSCLFSFLSLCRLPCS